MEGVEHEGLTVPRCFHWAVYAAYRKSSPLYNIIFILSLIGLRATAKPS